MISKKNSLRVRYTYKLLTNLIGIPIGLITESLIPRGLGTKLYGDFSFISGFFQNFSSFIDFGSSNAFYDKLSKRPNDELLRKFYWNLVGFISVIFSFSVVLLIYSNMGSTIWPDQLPKYIIMGLIFGFLYWYSQIILKVIDAYALTKKGELVRILQRFLRLFIILPMYFFDFFSLDIFFIYNYVVILFSIICWIYILYKEGITVFPRVNLSKNDLKVYSTEFYLYCFPLIIYSSIALTAGVFDRWILQISAGSIEQGYYGIAYQISTICFIFTSAMTPLIFREFSVHIQKNDLKRIRAIFKKYIPMLYSTAAYFGVFIAINSEFVGFMIGGHEFADASICIAIMAMYPIHQTYGQLSSSLYYSTDRTSLYKNIGGSILIIGIPISFLFISDQYGLNLGGVGLALKMVFIQLFQTNLLLYYNTKFLKEKYSYFVLHQIYSVLFFVVIGLFTDFVVNHIFSNYIISFFASGLLYTIFVVCFVFIFPSIFALDREGVMNIKNQSINFFKKWF